MYSLSVSYLLETYLLTNVARMSPPLPTNHGPAQMDQRTLANAPTRTKNHSRPAANGRNAKLTRPPDAPRLLARPPSLETVPLDIFFASSSSSSNLHQQHSHHPTAAASRIPHYPRTEHLFPLVRRPAKLSRCQTRPSRIRRRTRMFAARSSGRSRVRARRIIRAGAGKSLGDVGGLRHDVVAADAGCG